MRSTLAHDAAWAAGHRAPARPAWIGFVLSALGGLATWFGPSSWLQPLTMVVVLVLVVTVIAIFIEARKVARGSSSAARSSTS